MKVRVWRLTLSLSLSLSLVKFAICEANFYKFHSKIHKFYSFLWILLRATHSQHIFCYAKNRYACAATKSQATSRNDEVAKIHKFKAFFRKIHKFFAKIHIFLFLWIASAFATPRNDELETNSHICSCNNNFYKFFSNSLSTRFQNLKNFEKFNTKEFL